MHYIGHFLFVCFRGFLSLLWCALQILDVIDLNTAY